MKHKKQLLRHAAQEDGRMGRYQVTQNGGFYYTYQEDGGGQDRGPTHLGVFVTEEEARACLRRQRRNENKKSGHRKK